MNIPEKIERAKKDMPVLAVIREEFVKDQLFRDIKINVCLHLTKETAVLLDVLAAGGADIVACASNPLSTQDDVVEWLRSIGISVYGKRGESVEEYNQNLAFVAKRKCDLVIDDGADLTMLIHENMDSPDGYQPFGGLEETTTGVQRIKSAGPLFPRYNIIAVNDTPTKNLFDNVYGTGQSVLDGIMRATNALIAGKTFVVAGYGHCGKGLSQRARGMGANVIVTEIDAVKALQARMDGFRVMTMAEAAPQGDIFVTVTGNRDVITGEHMAKMKKGAILANAGHFDVEIDVPALRLFPDLILLGEGRLVNLVCAEGHPSEVMDMSFANQALCARYLVETAIPSSSVLDVPAVINQKVAELKLKSFGIQIDELSDEQKKYIGIK